MPFELAQPIGLSVLAILPLVIYFALRSLAGLSPRRRAVAVLLRSLLVVLLALALADVRYRGTTSRVWRVFAIDGSLSMHTASAQFPGAYLSLPAAQPRGDVAEVLYFAGDPRFLDPILPPDAPRMLRNIYWPLAERQETDIALAIAAARGAIPEGYVPQIILQSDGNQTRGDALLAAKTAGVPIDVMPVVMSRDEVYVGELRAPAAVRPGIEFPIEATVCALSPCKGVVHLLCGVQQVAEQPLTLKEGDNTIRFQQSLPAPGEAKFTVRLSGFPDTLAENNEASILVTARSKPRALLVEGQRDNAKRLAAALEKNQFDVARLAALDASARDALVQADLVVLVNVPASAIAPAQQKELADYLQRGGGLLLVGGDQAFTPGGYKGATLETILPLRSAVKDKPRPPLALLLVIDTSMSMQGASIDLSRQAAGKALQMLDAKDEFGLLSFADESRWLIPLQPCRDKAALGNRVKELAASGRTNMAPALQRAILALGESWIDRRHIVLMTDGLSDPGDFRALSEQARKCGVTISTVALGDEAAQDLLKAIAQQAQGRFHYCRDASSVPAVFEMEASSAGNIGITEEAVQPERAEKAEKAGTTATDLGDLPTLTGFVETQPYSGSSVLVKTADGDPILATTAVGRGRSTAFTSDVQSRWAAAWLKWPEFDRFWTQIARDTMRKDDDGLSSVRTQQPDYPAELRIKPVNTQLLQAIAAESGGRFEPTPEAVWASPGQTVDLAIALRGWLLVASLLIFIAGVAVNRLGRKA